MAPGLTTLARLLRLRPSLAGLLLCAGLALACALLSQRAGAATTVRVSGPGGAVTQSLPDEGGSFDVNLPLSRNRLNTLTITATDANGRQASRELRVSQLSLDSVVVTQITATPLTVQQIQQLVNDGVIDLDDPSNFNVSQFNIVLTIGHQQVPISIPLVTPKTEEFLYEPPPPPPNDGAGDASNPNPPDVTIFEIIPPSVPGAPAPPRIPGVILIEGRIKSLKEFYSVRLLLLNASGIFTLHDVLARATFPDGGLSHTLPADGIAAFGDILPGDGIMPGQVEREFIIRGDEIGVRRIQVDFSGTLIGGGIPDDMVIPFGGSAVTDVEVKGPPSFLVRVDHSDFVVANVPYNLDIEITNTGQTPALYASLDLDVGGSAQLLDSRINPATGAVEEFPSTGTITRTLGNIMPGDTTRQRFRINPLQSGPITSCMGLSDQNINLQVNVGNLGCLTGHFPPDRGDGSGAPTVAVLPSPNMTGVSIESPIVAIFSNAMNEATITTGLGGTFLLIDDAGEVVPTRLWFQTLNGHTIALLQVEDNITNRLAPDSRYRVFVAKEIADVNGAALEGDWHSEFRTTNPDFDTDPPQLTLTVLPPVDPNNVLPGQLVRVDAYAADQGTGLANVELRLKDLDNLAAPSQLIDQKTYHPGQSGPVIFTIDSARLTPGHSYQLRGTAVDRSGNAQDATLAIRIATTAAAPTITLPAPPTPGVVRGVSFNLTPTQVSGGVKQVAYTLDGAATPFATTTLAPYAIYLPTTPLTHGTHSIRAVVTDGIGQTGEATLDFEVLPNTTRPVVSISGIVPGTQLIQGATLALSATAEDATGVASIAYFLDGAPLGAGPGVASINTAQLALGSHTFHVIATNLLGVSNTPQDAGASVIFQIVGTPPGNPPPAAPQILTITPPASGLTNLTGSSVPGARIDVTNVTRGLTISVTAAGDGGWLAAIEAASGDVIRAVAYDFAQSAAPSAPAQATVPAPPALQSISVAPATLSFTAANAYQDLTVTGHYAGGGTANLTSQATFISSNPAVATVNAAGRVMAHASGTATIQVAALGQQAGATVQVAIVTLDSISVQPAALNFTFIGETVALKVFGHYSDGSTQQLGSGLTFATGDAQVVSVNAGGIAQSVTDGQTLVTVGRAGLAPVTVLAEVNTSAAQAPAVSILSPASGTGFERGNLVTVSVRGTSAGGSLNSISLAGSGAVSFNNVRAINPPVADSTQSFSFTIPTNAAIGAGITLTAGAGNANGLEAPPASITLTVVDRTAPQATITAPPGGTAYNINDTVTLKVQAADAVGVTRVRYATSGAVSLSGFQDVAPAQASTEATFTFKVPFGLTNPDLTIHAYAADAAGNEGTSLPINLLVADAITTPPTTRITSIGNPGGGASTLINWQVTEGLAQFEHVLLYYRRNGIGTFNLYTDATHPEGRFTLAGGSTGAISFDSTRMGGDGTYEFFTAGVSRTGSRQSPPRNEDGVVIAMPNTSTLFNSGAPVAVITSDAEIVDTNFDNRNLRIDGARVTLVGFHSFRNVELVNGAVLTHREATADTTANLNFSAWTVSIDATSAIDLTGRGYLGGKAYRESGRTLGNAPGSQFGSGGSYGGLGGSYGGGPQQPNPVYGDLTNPQDLGSGGGAWEGIPGGNGGGLLALQAINLAVDGAIRVNGAQGAGSAAGDGSGGAGNLQVTSLSGLGTISANGGARGAAGGGGRVAVTYVDLYTMNTSRITAIGGSGAYGTGANGTVFLSRLGEGAGELVIEGQGPGTPLTYVPIPQGTLFDAITLRNYARVVTDDPIAVRGTLRLTGNSTLAHSTGNTAGLLIQASDVVVEAGSAIDATGRGYLGGKTYRAPGQTLRGAVGAPFGMGGSHGGWGAGYDKSASSQVYGNPLAPNLLGAGGGAWESYVGGEGGGRITISASRQVIVEGAIRADGGLSAGSAAGNGAGGSVWITTSRLAGSGSISANGGGSGHGVAGGGGRVLIESDFVDPDSDFDDLARISAFAGRGQYDSTIQASAGSVVLRSTGRATGLLIIDDNRVNGAGETNATAPRHTPLTPIGPGVAQALAGNTLTGDGQVEWIPGGLAGLRLNPDLTQSQTFSIIDNTTMTISVVTPNENGAHFVTVGAAGRVYGSAWSFENVTLRRGGSLMLYDPLTVSETLTVQPFGLITHPSTSLTYLPRLALTVDHLAVETGGRIDVTGRGYLGGKAYRESGRTFGNALGSKISAGGSHGGLGSTYDGNPPGSLGGDILQPDEFGSGGGAWESYATGNGGGRVRINAQTIQLDGAIRANGSSGDSASGNGAGGSIRIAAATINGTGTIEVNGGAGSGTGGGGGRLAISYTQSLTIPETNLRSVGGQGQYGARAGDGTVFILRPGQVHGDLIIDARDANYAFADSSSIPGGLTFDNIELRNKAEVTLDAGLTAADRLRLSGGARLRHVAQHEAGLVVDARRIEVDAASTIDASGRGYRGGRGYRESGRTLGDQTGATLGVGGSHGGHGGGYENRAYAPAYGDFKFPATLGSGGGAWDSNATGDGGGRITLRASESINVEGSVLANGTGSASASGAGSGGSVLIQTPLLRGEGIITANGGFGGVGGGGGRVALLVTSIDPDHNFNELLSVTALPGRGGYDTRRASAGTVYVKRASSVQGDLIVDDGTTSAPAFVATPLLSVGLGQTQAATANSLTLDGLVTVLPGALVGLEFNPDIHQAQTFRIVANTANAVSVQTPNANGVAFSAIAAPGKTYGARYKLDNLRTRRGGALVTGDLLEITGVLELAQYGWLTHPKSSNPYTAMLSVNAGTLLIDSTSRIDVSGLGYLGGRGYREPGRTLNNASGSTFGAGGSHGGLGGSYNGATPAATYGDPANPIYPGGGGGAWESISGGDGGGVVLITAGAMTVDGQILANGGGGGGSAAGSGAGGSVNIITGTLAGGGAIRANGQLANGTAGGGGRVAILWGDGFTLNPANVTAAGGPGSFGTASSAGSVQIGQALPGNLHQAATLRDLMLSAPEPTHNQAAHWELYR